VTPEFELGASSQLLDEETLVRGVPFAFVSQKSATARRVYMETVPVTSSPGEPLDKGPNWATVELLVVPDTESDIMLPFFVSYEVVGEGKDTGVGYWAVLTVP
jgi:hypothetical protein